MPEIARILILGGTAEARHLAARLAEDSRFQVATSLAGATRHPVEIAGDTRRGGFGGVDGLVRYFRDRAVDLVVDATHPFAATMSRHAVEACASAGVARLVVERSAWVPVSEDRWVDVADTAAAAARLPEMGRRVLLTIGRQEIDAFRDCADVWFLIRSIDPPKTPPRLPAYRMISARGPFELEDERKLLVENRIDCVISKNSGGADTYAKIEAARGLGLPVLMIARPSPPPGERVACIEDALAWIDSRFA